MEIGFGLSLAFFLGYLFAALQSRRSRRLHSLFWLRKMQIITLRVIIAKQQYAVKVQSHRKSKQRTPPWKVKLKKARLSFSWWEKVSLATMHHLYPSLGRLLGINPKTLLGWYKKRQKIIWNHLSQRAKKQKARQNTGRGRPPLSPSVQEAVCIIKKDNPGYGAQRISMELQKLGEKVSPDSVVRILKKNGLTVNKPGNRPRGQQNPDWKKFINRQGVCSMDFKTVFDTRCRQLFVLNIIEHGSRKVIHSSATYHPTWTWVAQRLREIFPYDTAPKYMLVDRDKTFQPIVSRILPSMGTIVRRIGYQCPWQNGVVERFNCLLQEELLDYVIPYGENHLNRLLKEYICFYNTSRPHMKLDGESPVKALPDRGRPSSTRELGDGRRLVSVSWLWGLHHSYCWER